MPPVLARKTGRPYTLLARRRIHVAVYSAVSSRLPRVMIKGAKMPQHPRPHFYSRRTASSRCMSQRLLLNRNHALHAEREVRRAMEVVRAGRDLREGDDVRLVRLKQHGAFERAHRVIARHVGAELRLNCRRNLGGIEADAVRATGDVRELDRIARLDRDRRGIEAIALLVAEHLHFDRLATRRRGGHGTSRRRCTRSGSSGHLARVRRSSRRGGRRRRHSRRIRLGSTLVAAGACAEDKYAREERASDYLHSYSLQYRACMQSELRTPRRLGI